MKKKKKQLTNLIENIFTSNIKTQEISIKYRLIVLNFSLLLGAISLGLFMIWWWFFENYTLVCIDGIVSLVFWVCFFYLRATKNMALVVNISSIMIILAAIIFMSENKNTDFGLSWAYIVPVYTMFLAGHKKGFILTFIFYVFLFFNMYQNAPTWQENGFNALSLTRFVLTSAILSLIAFLSELSFDRISKKYYEFSLTDALTNLHNRRKLDLIIEKEIKRHERSKQPLCLCILDIDNFKQINDNYGHIQGDLILQYVANTLKSSLREIDEVGRWGGEEFCIILPNTNKNDAMELLQNIKTKIRQNSCKIITTCSIGYSDYQNGDFASKLIKRADEAMYIAKQKGKNQVAYM